ncbi:hypothetical protein BDU57DRAFT_598120 [Ampelomyces quisqualis]|uniref:Uncharacterized protein n=1 Tax=Ampelomyces quisqualis TaxID=50730 RepID=A0A6A5QDZ9_AMPQU|nr:hypothetical protein BDU57DRAFT_598120 [Ampelomyces quisqualis]
MAASPRKRATRASFNQTWDDTDAALLDPSSLPVARLPRAWERKQETKRTHQGREKKIWRRFNLRSRASDATEEVEEEHDARSRAVKKQQQMSPNAMEKRLTKNNAKQRAFKATRWDRRKSVLPRKKSSHTEDSMAIEQNAAEEIEDEEDETGGEASYESSTNLESIIETSTAPARTLIPEQEDRRSTFTFTMDSETTADQADIQLYMTEGDNQTAELDASAEDATITHLFRSPAKDHSMPELADQWAYPKYPHIEIDREDLARSEEAVAIEDEQVLERPGQQHPVTNEVDFPEVEAEEELPKFADTAAHEALSDVRYPILPISPTSQNKSDALETSQIESHAEMVLDEAPDSPACQDDSIDIDMEDDIVLDTNADEEFTEASLQLDLQRSYEEVRQDEQTIPSEATRETPELNDASMPGTRQNGTKDVGSLAEPLEEDDEDQPLEQEDATMELSRPQIDDITDGLTLSFSPAKARTTEPTPRKLHSPPPPPVQSSFDDATMTIALDDDTALLKDFLNRAAASKAEKAAVLMHRRESLQNRRDSDVIRHALASPRKALEDKDPNSPSKYDNELTLDLSQNLTLAMNSNALRSPTPNAADNEDAADGNSLRGSRRSSRTKKSRLPALASSAPAPAQTSKISIRRADGTEHVVLKKSDAQELATLTRANTRKNKQGAFGVIVRLLKLAADSANLPPLDESTRELVVGKNIRWDEQLAYYQENPETVADRESLATPDELSMPEVASTPSKRSKPKVSKNSTPKLRRVRGLGTANGTPGKVLLAPTSLFQDSAAEEEKENPQAPSSATQHLPRPKASKIKKMTISSATTTPSSTDAKLPALEIMPVGIEPPAATKERKSRLAAPKKVTLPQSAAAVPAEGKENMQQQRAGITGATPKKGIPAPKAIVPPSVGVESGLPRRRGRRM